MSQFSETRVRGRGANGGGRRVYNFLRTQISSGVLPTGAKLPSTRLLANDLDVSRTTVTSAIEQLAAEGFISTAAGRVARVAAPLAPSANLKPSPSSQLATDMLSEFGQRVLNVTLPTNIATKAPRIDFLYGAVASRDFPTLTWKRAYQTVLLRQHDRLYYTQSEGEQVLRDALQGYLRRARGLNCTADQILIVHGAQQAIDLCSKLLLGPGSSYVFEDPGYIMARLSFESSGAKLLSAPVDSLGLDTSQLPIGGNVRLAYVTPSHQFPLGGVLPISRRLELLNWAQTQNAWIVEDDYDGEFRYGQRPIDALQAMDSDARVIYVGTFSKALSPQLRLAYMVLPPALIELFRKAKRLTDRHAPIIEQHTLADLITSGAYERHVRRIRRENERRRAALIDAVRRYLTPDAQIGGTAAGLHVVLWLPSISALDEQRLVDAALRAGVGVYAVSPLFVRPPSEMPPRPAGLTLGYASLTIEQIYQGMKKLGEVIEAMS
ncbi:PLP-dependent aminotransferase family protein [Comamonas sp.]|uniref:MocR-like pyridoxine biosynthesis transcription factor PdxR n=1 Tax=Comamonas sp. TaxID=34028 RepID=UPI00289E46F0|nr:PLP-dependent aminotransferase family protein [Comamonas sp.]